MAPKYLDENGLTYFWTKIKSYLATTTHSGLMSPEDKAKVDAITSQGTIAYYRKLESTYTTTGSISTIPVGISGLSTADMLMVDVDGWDFIEGTDYTRSGTDIVLTNPNRSGSHRTLRCPESGDSVRLGLLDTEGRPGSCRRCAA